VNDTWFSRFLVNIFDIKAICSPPPYYTSKYTRAAMCGQGIRRTTINTIFYDLYLFHFSPPVFSGVRVTRSLVLYVCFVGQCSSFCTISFGHCAVCSSSIYGFWLPLWYLHTLLTSLSGFNLVSLVVISIDLLKDVVCMCLICPVHCIYNCSEETVTLISGICSYWYCHHFDHCDHEVFRYLCYVWLNHGWVLLTDPVKCVHSQ
jgi:hypothetical protein